MRRGRTTTPAENGVSVLSTVRSVDANQWNNLVVQSDLGTLFHRAEWLTALEEGMDHRPVHVVVTTDTNPVAMLPTFVAPLSLPHDGLDALASAVGLSAATSSDPGYGGPVIATDEGENADRLFDALADALGPSVLYHRITAHDHGYVRYGAYLQDRRYEPSSAFALFVLDLRDGWTAVRDGMDKERQKALRRAHDQSFEVTVAPVGEDLDRTYEMYARNMDRVGGRTLPRSLFTALATHVPERVRVFAARVDGEEVGRYVHLLDEESSTLHHWLSAIPDRSCYDAHPSELLHERAIRWGIDEGYDTYSFDRAGSHFDNGVFRFKSKYGARAVPLLRWERGERPVAWPAFRRGRRWYRARER
jgi:hypothetical protein